ncbi:6,7-dimethyl-8-ribityllumazine synthase [Lepidopterella palustris CBS 459.81]|uniref:6,7-dimethyl-8-ribityllumazine synthase n=1 Tax=Lepidopterella palustris CBS 459.81 TaxID=1314670 RepID=A0A8E2JB00_9PEZI|nr:6,7-dimethyl-8-ribityllumazine synthase [Lepidopterella palustris CBS 459.81]
MAAPLKGPGKSKSYDGSDLRIGIVHARWNTTIVNALLSGAKKALADAGVREENVVVQSVPGSFELPFACRRMYASSEIQFSSSSSGFVSAATDLLGGSASDLVISSPTPSLKGSTSSAASIAPFDAIIAIGVLIKGETMHFEYIADAVSHGLMRIQLESGVPIVFGLLTVLTEEQGLVRAGIAGELGNGGHNHGEDWGAAAVELGLKRRGWQQGKMVD